MIEKKILKNVKLDVGTLLIASEKYWYYSDNKARNELGYSSRSVEETLYEAVDWITEQMNKRIKKKGNPKN
jgi:nucleoside-diphosphate-sugar epimerase